MKYYLCRIAQNTNRRWYLDCRGAWRSSPDRAGVLKFSTLPDALNHRESGFDAIAVESEDGFSLIDVQDLAA